MESMALIQCPSCKINVSETAYFCSNCGRPLRAKPEDISIAKQLLVYFVSFFLAPFGLGYAVKYLRQSDRKARTIGFVALGLTIIAVVIVVGIAKAFLEQQYGALNVINSGALGY